MQTVTLDEAAGRLDDLTEAAVAGEEILITKNGTLTVQLLPRVVPKRKRVFGSAKGLITQQPGFDEPLDDLKDYLE